MDSAAGSKMTNEAAYVRLSEPELGLQETRTGDSNTGDQNIYQSINGEPKDQIQLVQTLARDASKPASQPVPENDDLYNSDLAFLLFVGLFTYAIVTLVLAAWFLAWAVQPKYYTGIFTSLATAGLLLVAGIGPIWQEIKWRQIL